MSLRRKACAIGALFMWSSRSGMRDGLIDSPKLVLCALRSNKALTGVLLYSIRFVRKAVSMWLTGTSIITFSGLPWGISSPAGRFVTARLFSRSFVIASTGIFVGSVLRTSLQGQFPML